MKKRLFCMYLILIIVIVLTITNSSYAITGEAVTGRLAQQQTNVSIFVTAAVPALTITSPENKTYLTNTSLLLNYSVSNEISMWYNLDNTDNTTITSYVYFNTTQGQHILWLFANNTYGTTTRNVTFVANSTFLTINYDNYKGAEKGNSTDFSSYTYENIQNLSNIILENTDYGKILFNEAINLTDDLNPDDNVIDIDTYTNISSNRIEVDTTALPNFNKQASLWLYGLTFSNPRILMNGEVCPSDICVQESYVSGTLKFNVTQLGTYSAEETPEEEVSGVSGAGGGTGGRLTKKIGIDKEKIDVKLKQGQTKEEQITITNTGDKKLTINLRIEKIGNLVGISEKHFDLDVGKSKTISLKFSAREDTKPDLHTGKIIIKADGIEKQILISIKVETKKPLFDIKLEMAEKFLIVMPGKKVVANGIIHNMEKGRVDVNIEYAIKDSEDFVLAREQEMRAVEDELAFIKTFVIPEETPYGDYVFYAKVTYNSEVAIASSWFKVGKKPFFRTENILIITVILIAITLLAIIYELVKLRKYVKIKVDENMLLKEKLIKIKGGERK